MKIHMELGGERFELESAAISCVRYRSRYGRSVLTDLKEAAGKKEREGLLLRVCYEMLSMAHRPELPLFARLAYRDRRSFRRQAEKAVAALLDADGWKPDQRDATGEEFDEYELLATMAAAGVDAALLYELPVLHLARLLERIAEQRDPERKTYRRMSEAELAKFYNLHL